MSPELISLLAALPVVLLMVGGLRYATLRDRRRQPQELAAEGAALAKAEQATIRKEARALARQRSASAAQPPVSQPAPVPPLPAAAELQQLDPRTRTLVDLARLPREVFVPRPANGMQFPLFHTDNYCYYDLSTGGHWGVFGTTGSGKGGFLGMVALQALMLGPEVAELAVVDGKGGLDYGFCEQIAHARLWYGRRITEGAEQIVKEMEARNAAMLKAGARNVSEYQEKTGTRLPWRFVIFDEIISFDAKARAAASLVMSQGRAAGYIVFCSTQQPLTSIIPTEMQANLKNRIVFRLASAEYTDVALRRRAKSDPATYEPSAISSKLPGVGVLRQDEGRETLVRTPWLSDAKRDEWISWLVANYPRQTLDTDDEGDEDISLSVPGSEYPGERFSRVGTQGTQGTQPEREPESDSGAINLAKIPASRVKSILKAYEAGLTAKEIAQIMPIRYQTALAQVMAVLQANGAQEAGEQLAA